MRRSRIPLVVALLDSSKDYVLARNLLPALVPLLVAVAIGLTLRRARRAGAVLAVVLIAYSLGFSVWASVAPALQRPDWDAVAGAIGEPQSAAGDGHLDDRPGVAALLPLDRLLPGPASDEGFDWWVREVDFISEGPAPPPPRRAARPRLPPGSATSRSAASTSAATRCRARACAPLRLRAIRDAELNFRTNGVLLDGIGPR